MKKHILRMLAGLTGLGFLGMICFLLVEAPQVATVLCAILILAIVLALVYSLGDFIGYVFFDGRF